jgi:hypothetical protein
VTLDRDTWLLHRDMMEILNRIEGLLTVAHHERRAMRLQIKALEDIVKASSEQKGSFGWKLLTDSGLGRWVLTFFLGSTGLLAWSEAIKAALP